MLRVNLFLGVSAVACAIGVVAAQHQSRRLYTEFEQEVEQMHRLETEWNLLQLEQSTWAAHGRVEKIAKDKLQMRPPPNGSVVMLELRGAQ